MIKQVKMRSLSYATPGKILQDLAEHGLHLDRKTLYRLEEKGLFKMARSLGDWRVATLEEAERIKHLIWHNYFRAMGREIPYPEDVKR